MALLPTKLEKNEINANNCLSRLLSNVDPGMKLEQNYYSWHSTCRQHYSSNIKKKRQTELTFFGTSVLTPGNLF